MNRVLVAGATGYLGRFVTRAFKQRGFHVRVLVRNPDKLDQEGPFLEPAVRQFVDEVRVGEVTRPETLQACAAGMDLVFSSIGITRQRDGLTFRDVDYQGNRNLLEAVRTDVGRFMYVSVYNGPWFEHLAVIKAHEDFVRALQDTELTATIIRPTGYFSDISEVFRMARKGRVYLFGKGTNRINPIHGADLAEVCVEALDASEPDVPVGGPQVFSQNEIARLAFGVLGRTPKIVHVPPAAIRWAVRLIRPFNRHRADLLAFIATAGQSEAVAPTTGTRGLRTYFEELAALEPVH